MKMKDEDRLKNVNEEEIDLIELFRKIWQGRKLIMIMSIVFIFIGLLIVFTSTKFYKSEARLLPEFEDSRFGASQLLRQFSGLTGMSVSMTSGSDAISPDLYPDVLTSMPFYFNLMDSEISISSNAGTEKVSVLEYYEKYMSKSFWGGITKYTIRLPWTLMEIIRKNEEIQVDTTILSTVYHLNKKQFKTIKWLNNRIKTGIDQKTNIITITAEFPDPIVSAQIAQYTVDYLKEYIIQYRIEKAQKILDFIQERFNEKKVEFFEAQKALAYFRDANTNIISESVKSEEQKLQDNYNLAYGVYNSLAQQLESSRIKVQEKMPVMKILEPVQIPVEKSRPRTSVILIISLLLGIFLSVVMIFLRDIWIRNKDKF